MLTPEAPSTASLTSRDIWPLGCSSLRIVMVSLALPADFVCSLVVWRSPWTLGRASRSQHCERSITVRPEVYRMGSTPVDQRVAVAVNGASRHVYALTSSFSTNQANSSRSDRAQVIM